MSRIFEVLERLQQDQELFRVPPVKKQPHGNLAPTDRQASIPDFDAAAREEVTALVQRLFFATDSRGRHGFRHVVLCGVEESVGSRVLCGRVGVSLADQVQSPVCLVDANLREPSHDPFFSLVPAGEALPPNGTDPKFTREVKNNLCVLSADSITTNGGTGTFNHVRTLIADLAKQFEYWVINAAPIGLCTDAALLGQAADGVVLVLEANSTRRAAALKAKQSLEESNVRVLGVVLTGRTFPIPEPIYRRL